MGEKQKNVINGYINEVLIRLNSIDTTSQEETESAIYEIKDRLERLYSVVNGDELLGEEDYHENY